MATRTETSVVDDLDGSTDDVVTCYLALGETAVEIDLSAANREELENFLERHITAGRKVRQAKPTRRKASTPVRSASEKEHTHDVRQWAKDQGLQVSERGRISREVQEAYEAAH